MVAQWQGPCLRVSQHFCRNSPCTDQHRGAELRITNHADDQLSVAHDLFGDQQSNVAIVSTSQRQKQLTGFTHSVGTIETQAHQPTLRLVRQAITDQLGNDRKPNLFSCSNGRGNIMHYRLACESRTERPEQLLRLVFAERAPTSHGAQR